MTAQELFSEIRQYCEVNADPKLVKKYTRFFKEGYDAYGISQEQLRCKTESLIRQEDITPGLVAETSRYLLPTGKYEETSFAYSLLKEFKDQYSRDTFSLVDQWFDIGVINWGHCDVFCGEELIGNLISREIISLEDFSGWRSSSRKYKRRAVPVSMLSFLPLRDNCSELLDFIDPMMMDAERVVHQGLGWFLREAWKKSREETESFLLKWKNDAARLIFQYATEKMPKEERVRFRKDRK